MNVLKEFQHLVTQCRLYLRSEDIASLRKFVNGIVIYFDPPYENSLLFLPCLRDLLSVRIRRDLPDELRRAFREEVHSILGKGIVQKLCALLKHTDAKQNTKLKDDIVDCLFLICYTSQPAGNDVLDLLEIVLDLFRPRFLEDNSIEYDIAMKLLLCLYCSLGNPSVSDVDEHGFVQPPGNEIRDDEVFVREFQDRLDVASRELARGEKGYIGMIRLAWSIFLGGVHPDASVENFEAAVVVENVLLYIREVALTLSPFSKPFDIQLLYVEKFEDVLVGLLFQRETIDALERLANIGGSDSFDAQALQPSRYRKSFVPNSRYLTEYLRILGKLFEVLWEGDSVFSFFDLVADLLLELSPTSTPGVDPELFPAFLDLLSSISLTEVGATRCLEFLKGDDCPGSVRLSVFVTDRLPSYNRQLQRHQLEQDLAAAEGIGIHDSVQYGLLEKHFHAEIGSYLRLLRRIAQNSGEARVFILEEYGSDLEESLLFLFQRPVPSSVLGSVMETLAVFVTDVNSADRIWRFIEQVGMLPPPIASGRRERTQNRNGIRRADTNSGGLRYQLENAESAMQTYPETRGFLRLLHGLLQWRVPGDTSLSNYVEFVVDDVFVKADTRSYVDDSEIWKVLSYAMICMLDLLEEHLYLPRENELTSESDIPPRFAAWRLMLKYAHGDSVLNKLLAVVRNAHGVLIGGTELGTTRFSRDAEASVLAALKLLSAPLELFKNMALPQVERLGKDLTRLAPKLWRDSYLVANIADFVCYQLSSEVRVYASNLMYLVSTFEPRLASALLSSGNAGEIISKFSAQLSLHSLEWQLLEPERSNQHVVAENIVRMLANNAPLPGFNITHLLCGVSDSYERLESDAGGCLITIIQALEIPELRTLAPAFCTYGIGLLQHLISDYRTRVMTINLLEERAFTLNQLRLFGQYAEGPHFFELGWIGSVLHIVSKELSVNSDSVYLRELVSCLFHEVRGTAYDESGLFHGSMSRIGASVEQGKNYILDFVHSVRRLYPSCPRKDLRSINPDISNFLLENEGVLQYSVPQIHRYFNEGGKCDDAYVKEVLALASLWNSYFLERHRVQILLQGLASVMYSTLHYHRRLLSTGEREELLAEICSELLTCISLDATTDVLVAVSSVVSLILESLNIFRIPCSFEERSGLSLSSKKVVFFYETLVNSIMVSRNSDIRYHLYVALLNMWIYTMNELELPTETLKERARQWLSSLTEIRGTDYCDAIEQVMSESLRRTSEGLVNMVMSDAASGSERIRKVALRVLEALIHVLHSHNCSVGWNSILENHDVTLQRLVDGYAVDNASDPSRLEELQDFVCVLVRLALTDSGARAILNTSFLNRLNLWSWLDDRMRVIRNRDATLLPIHQGVGEAILMLLNALLLSDSPDILELGRSQVLSILFNRRKMFASILRGALQVWPDAGMGQLVSVKEVSLVCKIFLGCLKPGKLPSSEAVELIRAKFGDKIWKFHNLMLEALDAMPEKISFDPSILQPICGYFRVLTMGKMDFSLFAPMLGRSADRSSLIQNTGLYSFQCLIDIFERAIECAYTSELRVRELDAGPPKDERNISRYLRCKDKEEEETVKRGAGFLRVHVLQEIVRADLREENDRRRVCLNIAEDSLCIMRRHLSHFRSVSTGERLNQFDEADIESIVRDVSGKLRAVCDKFGPDIGGEFYRKILRQVSSL